MAPISAQVIGRYRVLDELGQGGTANVFLAVSSSVEGFNKLVVLKRMKPQLTSEPGFATMFLDEARLAARLAHPNIVQTYEVIKDGGLPVIVMEYLEGQTLANLVARAAEKPGLELHHHLAIISEALTGLHYSHELCDFDEKPLDVVHRDMTPHNVFITFDGQVKILDFGIAKLSGSLVETESGVIKGKLRYIPPEQIVGEKVDRRADVYSVGVMLWEAATREKMWRGLSDATIMNRVINGEIPRPSDVSGKVPPELERIVLKALSPERDARQASARDLQLELDAFRAKLEEAGPRELGPLLGKLFKTERERQRRTIEEQLGAEHLGKAPESRGSEDATPSNYAVSERSRARRPARPFRAGVVAFVVLASAALAAFVLLTKPDPPASRESLVADVTAKAAETIEVRIRAAPSSAVISIDGVPATNNPALLFVDPDDSLHEVRASAEGYEEAVESVRFDRNRTLVLRLSKHVTSPVPSALASSEPGATAPKAPKARERERARPAPNDCDPPFTIDERGIKRFKPSCVH